MTITSANLLLRLIRRFAVRGELVEELESLSLDIKGEFPSQSQLNDWRINILIAMPEEEQNAVRMLQELLSGHPTE